jgi:Domain of Unknown Function (DUF928)
MTKKIEFWLVCATLAVGATVSLPLIDLPSGTTAPTPQDRSTGIVDRLIFVVNGSGKKQPPHPDGKRRTKVAGSRGCGTDIVALMPQSNLGVTISTDPTWWFYLAPSNVDVKSIQFRLLESDSSLGTEIWTTQLLPKPSQLDPGLLQVKYQGKPLINGTYQWQFRYQQVGCDRIQTVAGYLHKTTVPQFTAIENPRERLIYYAKQGIWHELLTELITLRQQQPENSQLNIDLRSIFESNDVKYRLSTDETQIDRELLEQIVNARVIDLDRLLTAK